MKRRLASLSALLLLLLLPMLLAAQQQKRVPFIRDSLNVIRDEKGSLNKVLEELRLQKEHRDSVEIPILHIGDSHLQAGFITRIIRTNLQKEFGNAGLGLVVPLKLAGTNQPRDYRITSDGLWEGGRSAVRNKAYVFGISGIAIQTADSNVSIRLEAMRDSANDLDYRFNKVTVFHDSAPFLKPDSSILASHIEERGPNAYSISLPQEMQSLQLLQLNTGLSTKTFHAFNLENGMGGVIYHTVGVNGAQYRDYCNIPLLFEQSKVLAPKLIIISLGTNESFERTFTAEAFTKNIDCLVKGLKKANPSAIFILTTPAEDFRRANRKRIPNDRIGPVRNAIVAYAKKNGMAYWDCFEASGGTGSCYKWRQNGLMARDMIHFNVEGYELQGRLFFEAFMKLYTKYVAEHRVE